MHSLTQANLAVHTGAFASSSSSEGTAETVRLRSDISSPPPSPPPTLTPAELANIAAQSKLDHFEDTIKSKSFDRQRRSDTYIADTETLARDPTFLVNDVLEEQRVLLNLPEVSRAQPIRQIT